jgi:hypothetical protein
MRCRAGPSDVSPGDVGFRRSAQSCMHVTTGLGDCVR